MKYGIITHYDVHNHGAILQLNALVNVLHKAFGISATALQFDKNYDFMGRELKAKYEISAKSFGIYVDYLRERNSQDALQLQKETGARKFQERKQPCRFLLYSLRRVGRSDCGKR